MLKPTNISALILCGGESSRMGKFKGSIPFDVDKSFAQKIAAEYDFPVINKLVFVVNKKFQFQLESELIDVRKAYKIVINNYPERGRINSILLGLGKMKDSTPIFIQNVDNPFVTSELLLDMIKLYEDETYVKPVYNGKGGHPILLGSGMIKEGFQMLSESEKLSDWLHQYEPIIFKTNNPGILININTPDDYHSHFDYLGKGVQNFQM